MSQLLFVYNANSGAANGLLDYGKKYITPDKYDCQLCMVSYGPFGMKKDWKQFIASLPYEVVFLHKDELEKQHPQASIKPPGLLLRTDSGYRPMLEAADFEAIKTLDQLKSLVNQALRSLQSK